MDFSFIIPCYNLAKYLPYAIDSALAQTHGTCEVIVIDDGSTDDTPEVARRYGDRIRYIRKPNAGLSAARNTGILESHGRFLSFLDADDTLDPGFTQAILEASLGNPSASVFVVRFRYIDTEGQWLRDATDPKLERDVFHQILGQNLAAPVAFSVRRSCFANAGMFDVSLTSCEDWEMWLRLAATGYEFHAIEERLANYREVPGSMSKNGERMWRMGLRASQRARSFAGHGYCRECRTRTRFASVRRASSFVVPSVWGVRESRGRGDWYQRPLRLYPMLARNPSMIFPYFIARLQRALAKITPNWRTFG